MVAGMMAPETAGGTGVDEETAKRVSASVYVGEFKVSPITVFLDILLTQTQCTGGADTVRYSLLLLFEPSLDSHL